jgi:hypothetical protein
MRGASAAGIEQRGIITEVHHDDGSPPYVVHWLDNDHEALVFPGPDATVVTAAEQREADARLNRRLTDLRIGYVDVDRGMRE